MAEFPYDDVTRLAEMLPNADLSWSQRYFIARDLIERGVTLPPPPPDPAVVVAEALWRGMGNPADVAVTYVTRSECLAAVRDVFPTDALEAAAKIVTGGEESSGVAPHGTAAPCTDPSGDTAAAKVHEAES